jgi:SAM-dependent methyltransferase
MSVMLEFRPVAGRRLSDAVERFLELERASRGIAGERLYHEVLSSVHELCAAIVECEQETMTREQIVEVLQPVRDVHARSPFVERLQKWPEGYAGDFKTVEYICNASNQAPANSIEYFCEQYALTRAIAQQHRNKVQIQAARILRAMLEKPGESKILSIACGSCPDLRSIPRLESIAGEIWLNDADRNALDFAQERLGSVREKLHVVHGRVPRATLKIDRQFDLVMAGGLFDYLPEAHAIYLIRDVTRRLLAPGGTFFFTNIARGNPYRPLIEYFGDWKLIERTEDEIVDYCLRAGVTRDRIRVTREATRLALIIEIVCGCGS